MCWSSPLRFDRLSLLGTSDVRREAVGEGGDGVEIDVEAPEVNDAFVVALVAVVHDEVARGGVVPKVADRGVVAGRYAVGR